MRGRLRRAHPQLAANLLDLALVDERRGLTAFGLLSKKAPEPLLEAFLGIIGLVLLLLVDPQILMLAS